MKLPELMKRFEKKYKIRVVAGVLVVSLVAQTVPTYRILANKTAKETVEESKGEEESDSGKERDSEEVKQKMEEALDQIQVEEKEIGKEETV